MEILKTIYKYDMAEYVGNFGWNLQKIFHANDLRQYSSTFPPRYLVNIKRFVFGANLNKSHVKHPQISSHNNLTWIKITQTRSPK